MGRVRAHHTAAALLLVGVVTGTAACNPHAATPPARIANSTLTLPGPTLAGSEPPAPASQATQSPTTSSSGGTPEPAPTSTSVDPTPAPPAGGPPSSTFPTRAHLVPAWIPYPDERKQQMADYALARYGTRTWHLTPQAIVIHFTATSDDPWSTITYFASNDPSDGAPGVCAHFVIGQDGTAYQLVPTDVMCRHTIGLNHLALGIEVAQSTHGSSSQWAEDQIFDRPAQLDTLVRLVKDLQSEYGIPTERILGHGTANDDPAFLDLTGRRNDHTDWGPASIRRLRDLVASTP